MLKKKNLKTFVENTMRKILKSGEHVDFVLYYEFVTREKTKQGTLRN